MLSAALGIGQIGRQYGRLIDLAGVEAAAAEGRLDTIDLVQRYFAERSIVVHRRRIGLKALPKRSYLFPSIAVLRNGNALMVTGVRKNADGAQQIYYIDPVNPGTSPQPLDLAEFGRMWSGELLLVAPESAHASSSRPLDWRWFWPEITRHRSLLILVVIASLLLHGLAFVPIIYLKIALDKVLVYRATQTLWVLTGGVVAALGVNALIGLGRDSLLRHMARAVEARIAGDSFDKLLALSPAAVQKMGRGRAEAALRSAVTLRHFVFDRLLVSVLGTTAVLVLLPIMMSYSIVLALVVLAFAVAMAIAGLVFRALEKKRQRALTRAEDQRDEVMRETLGGMALVKALAQEENQRRRWRGAAALSIVARDEREWIASLAARSNSLLRNGMTVAVVFVGVELVLSGSLTAGSLIAIHLMAQRIIDPIVRLAGIVGDYERAEAARTAAATLWSALPERTGVGYHKTLAGRFTLHDVSLSFDGRAQVLQNLSIALPASARIAVVGPSGAGKTMLLRLLGGLNPPSSGTIEVDGSNLAHLDMANFRRQVAFVDEAPAFFLGTIDENLRRPRPNVGERELEVALTASGLAAHLPDLPDGLQTVIDEQASSLPGAVRLKLALARALVVNPRVLLIDEAVDALDKISQLALYRDWYPLAGDRTLMVVTHNLPLVAQFDLIVVLDHGRLVGSGRHDDLLRTCPVYAEMWAREVELSARPGPRMEVPA